MKQNFPDLVAAERKRNYFITAAVVAVVFALLAVLVAFVLSRIEQWVVAVLLIIICLVTWGVFKMIHKYIEVLCPNCSAPIDGNYAESSRYSDANVRYNCDSCGSSYLDGVLED